MPDGWDRAQSIRHSRPVQRAPRTDAVTGLGPMSKSSRQMWRIILGGKRDGSGPLPDPPPEWHKRGIVDSDSTRGEPT